MNEKLSYNDPENIAQTMKRSLESTARALKTFSESLERSGFKKSIPAYQQMQQVLIQQRLWADRQSREELRNSWEDIAHHSDEIYHMIEPFVQIMGELRNIDKIRFQPCLIQESQSHAQHKKILDILRDYKFVSANSLAHQLTMEKQVLIDEIQPLVDIGIVEKRGRGNGISYRACQRNK